ncbi:MAG: chorismate synthase, partial [SAR324 cluster bacterium]|nr:chorismate synthase [SAR324 cluster bacterium]
MNTFGRVFRVSIYGESHGCAVGVLIDGCPAGLPLLAEDFYADLMRRKGGQKTGTTPRTETDEPLFRSGIFNNCSTGAPMLIEFANSDAHSADYEQIKNKPRPGHA